mmetsp:Transcript_1880/g.7831  ORF Transcript_1880/g.7831 Transcript_1880/m.7831 type:complete len:201 (+) Transcript_1880:729-1331(+)
MVRLNARRPTAKVTTTVLRGAPTRLIRKKYRKTSKKLLRDRRGRYGKRSAARSAFRRKPRTGSRRRRARKMGGSRNCRFLVMRTPWFKTSRRRLASYRTGWTASQTARYKISRDTRKRRFFVWRLIASFRKTPRFSPSMPRPPPLKRKEPGSPSPSRRSRSSRAARTRRTPKIATRAFVARSTRAVSTRWWTRTSLRSSV